LSKYANARNVGSRIQDHDFRADEGRIKLSPRAFLQPPGQNSACRGGFPAARLDLGLQAKEFFNVEYPLI
jgi:hypothetical protein